MQKITLWKGKGPTGPTFDLVVDREVCFFHKDGVVVVFVVMHYLPQSILDWIHENHIRVMSWFGNPEMRLMIPIDLIDMISSYKGEIPMYVPRKY